MFLIALCLAVGFVCFEIIRKLYRVATRKAVTGKIVLVTGAGSGIGREVTTVTLVTFPDRTSICIQRSDTCVVGCK
jgi:FlaA1/EpsC-like NDP-sugar epimerase